MYSYGPPHMAEQKQDDQLKPIYSSSVRIRYVDLRTCQKQWTIGRSGKRGSEISMLAVRHDDDDIYIYTCPLQTDCFVVSQLFSVARHTRYFKLGLKSGCLYVSQIPYSWAIVILSVSEGIFYVYIFTYTLSATQVFTSWEELCINAYVKHVIYIYIYTNSNLNTCQETWKDPNKTMDKMCLYYLIKHIYIYIITICLSININFLYIIINYLKGPLENNLISLNKLLTLQ